MRRGLGIFPAAFVATAAALIPWSSAGADLMVSQLVVELNASQNSRADVEVWNHSPERAYVAVDPREVIDAGTPAQSARTDPDPEKLGLLVTPSRMILEPGQRRLVRVASIAPAQRERIYRVTIRPVVGQLTPGPSGLKILVGYDMLVLVRPSDPKPHVSGSRSGDRLTLTNDGNVSVELADGQACASSGKCEELPGGRLYSGAQKTVTVPGGWRAEYKLRIGSQLLRADF